MCERGENNLILEINLAASFSPPAATLVVACQLHACNRHNGVAWFSYAMTYLEWTQQHYAVACLVLCPQLHSVFDGFALEACLVADAVAVAVPVAVAVAGELAVAVPLAGELAVAVAGELAVAVAVAVAAALSLAVGHEHGPVPGLELGLAAVVVVVVVVVAHIAV